MHSCIAVNAAQAVWSRVLRAPWTKRHPSGTRRTLAFIVALSLGFGVPARSAAVIVPDQWPTIQAALNSGAAEILVRPGFYPETPVVTRPVTVRGLVPAGSSPDSLPRIAGLVLDDLTGFYTHSGYITLEDLRFTSAVENTFDTNPYSNPLEVTFSRCVMDSGFRDAGATVGGQLEYTWRNCTIDGPVQLGWPDRVWFDSSLVRRPITITGYGMAWMRMTHSRVMGSGPVGVSVSYSDNVVGVGNAFEGYDVPLQVSGAGSVELMDNMFLGPGLCAIDVAHASDGYHRANTIAGYDVGIRYARAEVSARNGGVLTFENNRIENCRIAGMDVTASYAALSRDTILSCGVGVSILAEEATVQGLLIRSCQGDGLSLRAMDARIDTCVVGRCGGDGIAATVDADYAHRTIRLRENTSYLNGGSGYSVTLGGTGAPAEIGHNIGYGNGGHGLEVVTGSSTIGCNDWFGNAAGAVQGAEPAATDVAVDPHFCDLSRDDVSLVSNSPLADAAGCGSIGALGIGCETQTTPVLMERFEAWRTSQGTIVIGWRVHGAFVIPPHIERAEGARGPWMRLAGVPEPKGPLVTVLDQDAAKDRAYWYRLVDEDEFGTARVLGLTSIEAMAAGRFALEPVNGNPSPGPFTIRFRVPTPAAIDLDVFDLQGRRIAQLASGTWPAGTHEVRWSGRDAGGRIQSGVHLVRYRFPAGQATQRLFIIR